MNSIPANNEFSYYDVQKINKKIIKNRGIDSIFISNQKWNRALVNAQAKYVTISGLLKSSKEVKKNPIYIDFISHTEQIYCSAIEKMMARYGPEKDVNILNQELQKTIKLIDHCQKKIHLINSKHLTTQKRKQKSDELFL
ncbi:hypothetical protein CBF30_10535 [Vagococcus entomophilus]|uniref:Uncharacterized protein n=1 Tax=Vagococcus entomophilus TaxID=1160095 RepID=A0A430AEZ8_9ENTE|nr:hypothetical protein CBF30_10535 [Vagococcus entomophilus]